MFCVNCGEKFDDKDYICKGCGKLDAEIREELLAMSEKVSDIKCENCGEPLNAEHHYCSKCGVPIAS